MSFQYIWQPVFFGTPEAWQIIGIFMALRDKDSVASGR